MNAKILKCFAARDCLYLILKSIFLMLKAIILDCDGVLLKSNRLHAQMIRNTLEKYGIEETEKNLLKRFGEHPKEIFGLYFRGRKLDRIFTHYKKISAKQSFINRFRQIPGAAAALKNLSGKYRLILVSGGMNPTLRKGLKKFHFNRYLEFVVSGDDTSRHKPWPDCLQLALKKAKLKKKDVLYVGDAPNDAIAARRAGIRFVAVLSGVLKSRDAKRLKPYGIISDITKLESFINGKS